MKKLFALLIIAVVSISFGVDNNKRTDAIDSMCIVNVRTDDTLVGAKFNKIRGVFADVGGIVMMDMVKTDVKNKRSDTSTVVRALNDATIYPWTNIIKVYPLYNGTDSTTCQVYDTLGVLRRGIGLGF